MKSRIARTVLVTGGSRGIGAAVASAFISSGDNVFVSARSPPAKPPGKGGPRFLRADVRRPAHLRSAVSRATRESGRLDVLINAAGYSRWLRLERITEKAWTDMVDTNLKGVLFAAQAAAPWMSKGGAIVNVSSLAGKRGSANNAMYCGTKFGVNGITQALAKELGSRGIRVNAVCPAYVETDALLSALAAPDSPAGRRRPLRYLREFSATQAALGTLPTAEQVAQACLFLASPAASAITGQCVNVDCGVFPQ